MHSVGYLWIMVQSKVKGPAFLNQRISAFVNDHFCTNILASMSMDTFRTNVLACISKWGEKDKRMTQRSNRFFSALETNLSTVEFNGRFDRARALEEELNSEGGLDVL